MTARAFTRRGSRLLVAVGLVACFVGGLASAASADSSWSSTLPVYNGDALCSQKFVGTVTVPEASPEANWFNYSTGSPHDPDDDQPYFGVYANYLVPAGSSPSCDASYRLMLDGAGALFFDDETGHYLVHAGTYDVWAYADSCYYYCSSDASAFTSWLSTVPGSALELAPEWGSPAGGDPSPSPSPAPSPTVTPGGGGGGGGGGGIGAGDPAVIAAAEDVKTTMVASVESALPYVGALCALAAAYVFVRRAMRSA